jgi:hypothetical protein
VLASPQHAAIVRRQGRLAESFVQTVVDGVPFRTAAADHEITAVDGVRIGTVATQVLSELNTGLQA